MPILLDLLPDDPHRPTLLGADGTPFAPTGLRSTVEHLAARLAMLGVAAGERVAIVLPGGPTLALCFLAAATVATAAPLNPRYREEEFAFYYADTNATTLLIGPDTPPAALAAASLAMRVITVQPDAHGQLELEIVRGVRTPQTLMLPTADAVALVLHTSGTTSRPKRVPLRHRNLVASAQHIVQTLAITPDDTTLCVMPLFHIHGLVASLLAPLAAGGTVVATPGFDALRFWSLVRDAAPTWYSAVPTMHQMLLARAERNPEVLRGHRLRFVRSSSASLPPAVMEQLETVIGAPVIESYGMTEASHQMTSNLLPPGERLAGSVGFGVGVQVAIMAEDGSLLPAGVRGEVAVRGPNVMDGYENNPQADALAFVDGWFRTGDQGIRDAAGRLTLTGRLKELINRGGEKIGPIEIDDVLLRHPAVAEALAFAAPHPTLGEEVHAAVVLRPGAVADARALRDHCATLLADFKVPRTIYLLESLPRGATGKLQRIGMHERLTG